MHMAHVMFLCIYTKLPVFTPNRTEQAALRWEPPQWLGVKE